MYLANKYGDKGGWISTDMMHDSLWKNISV